MGCPTAFMRGRKGTEEEPGAWDARRRCACGLFLRRASLQTPASVSRQPQIGLAVGRAGGYLGAVRRHASSCLFPTPHPALQPRTVFQPSTARRKMQETVLEIASALRFGRTAWADWTRPACMSSALSRGRRSAAGVELAMGCADRQTWKKQARQTSVPQASLRGKSDLRVRGMAI